ncbi:MAG: hypothetical protein M3357_06765 [Actinomycetota bacterium]|nr:hypothetical protein [Actinomycetota bacterium]
MPTIRAQTPPSLGPAAGWSTFGGLAALPERVKLGGATMGRSTGRAGWAGGAATGTAAGSDVERARVLLASVACMSRESMRECDRAARAAGSSRSAETTSVGSGGEELVGAPSAPAATRPTTATKNEQLQR